MGVNQEMHICIIGQDVNPPWSRGHASLTRELINCIKGKVRLTVLTTYDRNNAEAYKPRYKNQEVTYITIDASKNNDISTIRLAKAFSAYMKSNHVDIVYMTQVNALLFTIMCRLYGLKNLLYLRHFFMPPPVRNSAKYLLKAAYSLIDGVAVSSASGKLHISNFMGDDKLYVIPIPIDIHFFKPFKQKAKRQNAEINMLYMGSLCPRRFPLSVLQAVKILKNEGLHVKLTILARQDKEYNQKWADTVSCAIANLKLSKNITVGKKVLSEQEKLKHLNGADIVIFPFDGYVGATDPPITMLEAMSCGKIVIGSKVGCIPELINRDSVKSGLLFNNLESAEIAGAIRSAVHPGNNSSIPADARKIIESTYSLEVVGDRIINMFEDLLKKRALV